MLNTLFRDYHLDKAILNLTDCIRLDTVVPLDVYTTLEDYGIEIDALIHSLERELCHARVHYNN